MATGPREGQPRPTEDSQRAGFVLQVSLAVVAGVLGAPSHGVVMAAGAGLLFLALLIGLWRQMGKWFSLVLAVDSTCILLFLISRQLGLTDAFWWVAAVPCVPFLFVATTATWMQHVRWARMTPVDPREVEVGKDVLEQLRAAGFGTEPDVAYGLYGNSAIVLAFAHRSQPAYAEVSVRSGDRPEARAMVSMLAGGGAVETTSEARFPSPSTTLRQAFPGADLATLTERHVEALAWARGRGIIVLPATPDAYALAVEVDYDGTSAALGAHPVWHAARHLGLRVLHRHLDTGPLDKHRHAGERLPAAVAGP